MPINKIIIIILVLLAAAGIVWSIDGFIRGNNNQSENMAQIEKNEQNFSKALGSELPDKCQTPPDYTDQGWQEHMSHHPDRYKECFENTSQEAMVSYNNITADDLADMLKHKDFTLIDVHTPEQKHIPGTDALIPFNEIVQKQAELPQDKDAKIVLYCRSGGMSRQAAKDLNKLGYSNVYNLTGGLIEWQQRGYSVESKLLP